MKQIKYHFACIFLLPFGYTFELANLDKIDAESPTSKTREERSPHYSSEFFSGFNGFPFEGGHHGSHESHHELDCPFPYKKVGQNCYYAKCTTTASDKFTWNAARTFCQTSISGGGDLAVFKSPNEYADAVRYIKSLDPLNATMCNYWIGGYDNVVTVGSGSQDIWTWITNKIMPLGVPYWGYNLTSSPITLLPINPSNSHEVFLYNADNYFFNQANGSVFSYFPLCQIRLEKKNKGHGGGSHEEHNFGHFHHFHPELRSDQSESFYPQLREINPVQNSHFRSSQVAPNNPFIRSFGNNPPNHRHRMPYVMKSQQRNLPIPGMFSARKAIPNELTQQSMINNENSDNQPPPVSKDSLLDKTINIETKEETILRSPTNNDKGEGLIQERAKESKSESLEVKKQVSTVEIGTEILERKIASDDLMNENEPDVNANIEVDEPGIQVKGEFAEVNLPVNEERIESNEQEEAVTNIPIKDTDILTDDRTEEFSKQNVQKKTSSADIDKANDNFNQVTKLEIDNAQETSEGKRSEFQSDPLNSYLPGMIYDIVNILQNIDRTYKPRFNLDRT